MLLGQVHPTSSISMGVYCSFFYRSLGLFKKWVPTGDNMADILLKFVEKIVIFFAGWSVCEMLVTGVEGRASWPRLWM